MTTAVRLPFIERDPARPGASQMPYVPIAFSDREHSLVELGLLDTGASVNVLPFHVGIGHGAREGGEGAVIRGPWSVAFR